MGKNFSEILETICDNDSRYKTDAYVFVMEALSHTQQRLKTERHISGEELLDGMRDLLLQKFGPMTVSVLEYWGIKSTEDFGNIVFNLVDRQVLSKTEEDNIDRFKNAYDFDEVFIKNYRKQLHKKISRMRSI